MSTPKNAPYKIDQHRPMGTDRFIPSDVKVEWDRDNKRFITWNRATRRLLERRVRRAKRRKLRAERRDKA